VDLRGKEWLEKGENYIMRNFITCTLYCYGDEIEEYEMGVTCSMRGTDEKCIHNFYRKT